MIGVISYATGQEVNGQKMMMGERSEYGNKTSGPQEKMMINGTINLQQTIFEAIGSKGRGCFSILSSFLLRG